MGVVEPPYTEKPAGSGEYIFMQHHRPPSISFVNTSYDDAYNQHHIRFSPGLDDDVLVTFPSFVYSEATSMPHKGDTSTADTNGPVALSAWPIINQQTLSAYCRNAATCFM
ncbi:hypothetical protein L1887_25230 [Cichorium endivia]|nr:hypothetical protein L1887_25230 [Cichorium endivia]